ncbi:hypothetical protein ElyMa_001520000 [Elysia marginata]|uniref:Transaldolase n=1 Tax=Elysia marginata TaxID=1093978 RepID=A0AAV4J9L0_9GAST|nr:hypothetical protein ElyMa_001520000 [Elysia marginata]
MKSLPSTTMNEFIYHKHWLLSKTDNKFSSIPFDQAHEQENKLVKGSGGVIGITQNPSALRRWMFSGPEISRLIDQFEDTCMDENEERQHPHHEQNFQTQKTFQVQVNKLLNSFEEMGNPFLDDFTELLRFDSRTCVDICQLTNCETLNGLGKYVFEQRSKSIHDPITRNSITIFEQKQRVIKHPANRIKVLQNNVSLFGQLYVAMQSRDSDIDEFFAHEIQSYPPSLSNLGKLRLSSNKSDLLDCLKCTLTADPLATFDCKVMDAPWDIVIMKKQTLDIVVHLIHALQYGAKTVQVRTVDTDVVVILVGVFHDLLTAYPFADIWIAFGMDKHFQFFHLNDICASLGVRKSKALPFFHAF